MLRLSLTLDYLLYRTAKHLHDLIVLYDSQRTVLRTNQVVLQNLVCVVVDVLVSKQLVFLGHNRSVALILQTAFQHDQKVLLELRTLLDDIIVFIEIADL